MPRNEEETTENGEHLVSYDLSAKVAEKVRLKDIRILSVDAAWDPTEVEFPLSVNYTVSTEAMTQEEGFRIIAQFGMAAKGTEEKGGSEVKVGAAFELQYEHPDAHELTEDDIESFGAVNGLYNAWPYWREFLQNMTSRMGLPALIAPVFRVADRLQQSSNALDEDENL
jgi:hypothetical protein